MSPKLLEPKALPLAVSVQEAGRMLSVTPYMIYQMISRRELRAQRIGKYWRIPTSELQRLLDGR